MTTKSLVITALDLTARTTSVYPQPFTQRLQGRQKRALGDNFHIKSFGVNLTHLAPGTESALLHRHSQQEEFIYILKGTPTLVTDAGEYLLQPGQCAGFTPDGPAHHLINRTQDEVIYIEVGNRAEGDQATYPKDDLQAIMGADGHWQFRHKNGEPY